MLISNIVFCSYSNVEVSQQAMRCLASAMVTRSLQRQIFSSDLCATLLSFYRAAPPACATSIHPSMAFLMSVLCDVLSASGRNRRPTSAMLSSLQQVLRTMTEVLHHAAKASKPTPSSQQVSDALGLLLFVSCYPRVAVVAQQDALRDPQLVPTLLALVANSRYRVASLAVKVLCTLRFFFVI